MAECEQRASPEALNTRIRSRPPNDLKRRLRRLACTISRSMRVGMRSIVPAMGITESSSARNTQRQVFDTYNRSMANRGRTNNYVPISALFDAKAHEWFLTSVHEYPPD